MPEYRVYQLDTRDRILSAASLEAADDAAAMRAATELCTAAIPAVELWCGARQVAKLACPPADAPSDA